MDRYIPFVLIPLIAWGVRFHLKKRNNYTPLKRITLRIALAAYLMTELGRSFYRPFIYHNHIDDWFIADTLGNSFGTITAIFMVLTLSASESQKDWKIVVLIISGLLGYELLNLTGRTAIDVNDLIATFIFGSLAAAVYFFLLKKYGRNNIQSGGNPEFR